MNKLQYLIELKPCHIILQNLNEYQVNSGLNLFVTTLDNVDSSTRGPDILDLAADGNLSKTSVKRSRKLKCNTDYMENRTCSIN